VIDVHKATYLQATSPAERKQITQEILADLFNHWSQTGILFSEVDVTIKTKALVAWIQNNWRPVSSASSSFVVPMLVLLREEAGAWVVSA